MLGFGFVWNSWQKKGGAHKAQTLLYDRTQGQHPRQCRTLLTCEPAKTLPYPSQRSTGKIYLSWMNILTPV